MGPYYETKKAWYARNRAKMLASYRRYYRKNKAKIKRRARRWALKNKARRLWIMRREYVCRRAAMRILKVMLGCGRCGYHANHRALEWHHRDPHKKLFNCAQISRKRETMLRELAKCDLLCSNCHAIEER